MNLPHRAPIGALRTQAGVMRSETPVKKSSQQTKYQRYDRNSVTPIGVSIYPCILRRGSATLHHLPVFFSPLSGLTITNVIKLKIRNYSDKILFAISCEIELGERKNRLKQPKNHVFHRNIACYEHNYMSYERNYVCYEC